MNLVFPYKEKTIFYIGCILYLILMICAFTFSQPLLGIIPFALLLGIYFIRDIRIPFFLLMLSIPLSFNLQEMTGISIDFPDEPLMLILTIAFIFFLFLNIRKTDYRDIIKNPLVILVTLSFFWMMITVIFSLDPIFSLKYFVKKIWYLIPFFFFPVFLFLQRENIPRSFKYMFIPLFPIVILIVYRFSNLGFRFEEVHDPLQPFFVNHVIYGAMISCFVPLTAGALILARKYSALWLIFLGALVLFLIAAYFSYSRASWLAIIFAAIAMIGIRLKVIHYMMGLFYIILFSSILWLSTNNHYLKFRPNFEKTIMHESLADHIMATIQGTDISSAERYYRWIAAIRMSVDHPITGVGPNNFYHHYKPYTINSYKTWVSRNFEGSTTHNYFLFMLAEQGYPAVILYGSLIFMIFYYGQRLYHRQQDRFFKIAVLSVLGMIAALFVNNFFSELLETDKIGSLFFLGIALLVAVDQLNKQDIKSDEVPLA